MGPSGVTGVTGGKCRRVTVVSMPVGAAAARWANVGPLIRRGRAVGMRPAGARPPAVSAPPRVAAHLRSARRSGAAAAPRARRGLRRRGRAMRRSDRHPRDGGAVCAAHLARPAARRRDRVGARRRPAPRGRAVVVGRLVDVQVPAAAVHRTTRGRRRRLAGRSRRRADAVRRRRALRLARGDAGRPHRDSRGRRRGAIARPRRRRCCPPRCSSARWPARWCPEFAAWLAGTGPVEAVERIGHSSGRGLVEGARLAMSGLERVAA